MRVTFDQRMENVKPLKRYVTHILFAAFHPSNIVMIVPIGNLS